MTKIIFFLSFFTASVFLSCGAPETDAGSDEVAAADSPQEQKAALSTENRKLFYETLNVRTIGYRKQLQSLQADGQSAAQITAAIELLSNPAFDSDAYGNVFTALFESIKNSSEAAAPNPYREGLTILSEFISVAPTRAGEFRGIAVVYLALNSPSNPSP